MEHHLASFIPAILIVLYGLIAFIWSVYKKSLSGEKIDLEECRCCLKQSMNPVTGESHSFDYR